MFLSFELAKSLKKKGFPQTGYGRWYCVEGDAVDPSLYDHRDIADLNRAVEGLEFVYAPTFEELYSYLPPGTTVRVEKGVNGATRILRSDMSDHEYMLPLSDSIAMYLKVLLKNGIITF